MPGNHRGRLAACTLVERTCDHRGPAAEWQEAESEEGHHQCPRPILGQPGQTTFPA